MLDLRELYQEVIVDHNRSPRNFHKMDNANRKIDGFNPLCGDKLTLFLHIKNNMIDDISFEGTGCAISVASASLMTELLKGKTVNEAEAVFTLFHDMIISDIDNPIDAPKLGKLTVLAGVREFPARIKCATLAWHSLHSAISSDETEISTE